MKDFKGYGRTRSGSVNGEVFKRHFNDYVNCLHTQVGHCRDNMEVYVAEFRGGYNDMNINKICQLSSSQNSRIINTDGISPAVTNGEKDGMPKIIQNAHGFNKGGEHIISPTITGSKFQDNNVVCEPLRIRQATKQGYIEVEQGGVFDATYPESTTRRGRVQEGGNIAPTLMASGDAPCRYEGVKEPSYRIRKLTPRECFRLMGVEDQDIDKIQQSGVSHTQQYKMAGNSIVVDCLYHIFRKLFTEQQSEGRQLTLF